MTEEREPCAGCGEPTSAGTVLFSSRRVVRHPDGRRDYVCSLCDELARQHHRGRRLTDVELQAFVQNGSMAALAWTSAGGHA